MISLIALCILGVFVAAILAAVWGKDKGQAGEMQIYNVLEQLEGQKAIISNCYLPLKDSGTTEVDLILIHESGIYVIESKNYSGWIFGSENHKYWTQSLPNHSGQAEKYQFYNPLWQNETHVRCLKSLLQNNEVPYYSYVVFGNNCEIKNLHLVSNRHRVTYYRYLLGELSENARSVGRCLTDEQINAFYSLLLKFTDASAEQKARHIEDVRAKHYPIIQPDGTWTCPQCGGRLVPRVARRGSGAGKTFWGCSNYPKCHFIYNE